MTTLTTKGMIVVGVAVLGAIGFFSYQRAHVYKAGASAAPVQQAQAAVDDGTPINACALLSADEVSAVVGAKVSAGQRRDDGEVGGKSEYAPVGTYSSTCFWRFEADIGTEPDPQLPMGGMRFAILNAMVWPASTDAAKFLQSFHDAFKEEIIPSEPIPVQIGDEGMWWGDGVAVRKAAKTFGISVFLQNGDKPSQRKMEEALARKIEPRV
jgi:hypothetical protein